MRTGHARGASGCRLQSSTTPCVIQAANAGRLPRLLVAPALPLSHLRAAPCRLLCALAALCGLIAASVGEELRSPSAASSGAGGLQLELSAEEQQRQLDEEEAEERALAEQRHLRKLSRDASLPSAEPPLPFLGPISGRLMLATCSDLLAAIQVSAQLALAGADLAGCARQLAEARAAADEDPELQAELRALLGAAAGAAATLAQHYPPFLALCRDDAWLAAETMAAGTGSGSCIGADAPEGLTMLLSTLAGEGQG